jgi:hypothetical protein
VAIMNLNNKREDKLIVNKNEFLFTAGLSKENTVTITAKIKDARESNERGKGEYLSKKNFIAGPKAIKTNENAGKCIFKRIYLSMKISLATKKLLQKIH